ncbi:MAG TPA: hypothetical protein VMR37_05105, partial [Rhabdochlamydiaceae bacterium]|nr:hypothetical protein [Rhabdochlamydiaceae bacterium]
ELGERYMATASNRIVANVPEFNCDHNLTDASAIGGLLKSWSERTKTLQYQSAGANVLLLTFSSGDTKTTLKIQDMVATHKYKWINEMTSFGGSELSKHYSLEVKGKDEQGVTIIFNASLFYDSEDGKEWSEPFTMMSFTRV